LFLFILVGSLMKLPKVKEPTEEINKYYDKFIKHLVKFFNTQKHNYIKNAENITLELSYNIFNHNLLIIFNMRLYTNMEILSIWWQIDISRHKCRFMLFIILWIPRRIEWCQLVSICVIKWKAPIIFIKL